MKNIFSVNCSDALNAPVVAADLESVISSHRHVFLLQKFSNWQAVVETLRLRGTWIAETVLLTYRLKEMWHADTTAVLLCCLVRTWAVVAVSRSSEMIPDPDGHWSTQTGHSQHLQGFITHSHKHSRMKRHTFLRGCGNTRMCSY